MKRIAAFLLVLALLAGLAACGEVAVPVTPAPADEAAPQTPERLD